MCIQRWWQFKPVTQLKKKMNLHKYYLRCCLKNATMNYVHTSDRKSCKKNKKNNRKNKLKNKDSQRKIQKKKNKEFKKNMKKPKD